MHRNGVCSASRARRNAAATKIQRAWIGYKNRQVFRLLKCTVAAAEHSLTKEILRKLAPREADFFSRDESLLRLRIRFRFGGWEFPPRILYKIYVDTANGQCSVKYVNGKGTIRAETDAAAQSAKLMGNRRYYDLMLQDGLQRLQHGVTDAVDVVTVKDFMRLLSVTDESQAEMGGKANTWRQLTSQAAPRHTVFRDVIDYLATRQLTERLRHHLPLLTAMPSSQEVRRAQLRVLAEVEAPRLSVEDRQRTTRRMGGPESKTSSTSRRSSRALTRAQKMREAYLNGGSGSDSRSGSQDNDKDLDDGAAATSAAGDFWLKDGYGDEADADYDDEEEDFEEEADMLYEWSKELTEGHLGSPRLA